MWNDPIVTEVRRAGQRLFEEAGNDLHVFFQRLREAEKKHPERVVELPRCASIDDPPRIIPYAGRDETLPAPHGAETGGGASTPSR